MSRNKKSQTFAIDMIIALGIFLAVFLSIVNVWDYGRFSFVQYDERNDLEFTLRYASDCLLATSGEPSNWHMINLSSENVHSIGLVSPTYGIINSDKLNSFIKNRISSYELYKQILGLRGSSYEFMINISIFDSGFNYLNSSIIGYTGECSSSSKLRRISSLDNSNYVLFDMRGCKK